MHLSGDAPTITSIVGEEPAVLQLTRLRRSQCKDDSIDPKAATVTALNPVIRSIPQGASVAVAIGSRGIANLVEVIATTVAILKGAGAFPFIIPAMGSHGGATVSGQLEILTALGISETSVQAPIRATMETVDLGQLVDGLRVFIDRNAVEADAILAVNRVKSHTSFTGSIESGIAKMLAIGLGKQSGAKELHRLGPLCIEDRIVRVASFVVDNLPVIGGLALLESQTKNLHAVEYLAPRDIGSFAEADLLVRARGLEKRLPTSSVDVLIVDEIGKNLSGTGMDTNVIGRRMVRGSPEPMSPIITNIVALSLTPESHGNAVGFGLADFVPQQLMADVDCVATYANALTAGVQGVQRAQVPVTLATDRDAIAAALFTAAVADLSNARMVRIKNTLDLDEVMVSSALVDECESAGYQKVDATGSCAPLFGADGKIRPFI